ncbi:Uncharacterised protein [Actinomyces bovis]|uniref:ParB/Sulfiredoxin domain-containing protein n=1 Tax=Actinomyces bovis TaxID=1658 RepID=A0ABY1VPX2_9ACTO|nr:hypothetical protein [Actinomyces bovis]SPT53487.1 Uncharacterised protein [Actinomyces bovis]VEG55387.1 Uncharacterised protein [Actinomyces israelii]
MDHKPPRPRAISRLHLDLRNPRLGRHDAETEEQARARLLDMFGDKIVVLAKSVAEHGLSPAESWIVVKEGGRYVVLEGNRRLVACYLLQHPDKAPASLAGRFKSIRDAASIDVDAIKPSCVELERRADARYWIQLRHHGAGDGEGTASWGPEMVYLDQVNNGGARVEWNEFWYWLEEAYDGAPSLATLIDRARREQYTLMGRVYNWGLKQHLKATLGPDGRIRTDVDPSRIRPFIEALVEGMLRKPSKSSQEPDKKDVFSSRTLNTQASAESLLTDLWERTIGDNDVFKPPAPPSGPGPVPSGTPDTDDDVEKTQPTPADSNGGQRPGSGKSSTPSNKPRKSETHLYHGVPSKNMPDRVRDLLRECASIEIKTHPETASVMARVVVELAVDALIHHRDLQPKNGTRLYDKIAAVLRHLDPKLDAKTPERPELSGTWAAVRTDQADGHLLRDLNDCVHSYRFTAATEIAERANRLFPPLLNAINDDLGKPDAPAVATDKENRQA